MHTLDDLVFASFQGPVLSLDSRVLHRYRRSLSKAQVAAALLRARCRVPGTLEEVWCRSCGEVLEIAENEPEQQRLQQCARRRRAVRCDGADAVHVVAQACGQHDARPAGLVIGVCVVTNAPSFTEDDQRQVTSGMVAVLRAHVPGYLMQKASMRPTVVIIVAVFNSLGARMAANQCGRLFLRNEIRNPLGRNLLANGCVEPVLFVTKTMESLPHSRVDPSAKHTLDDLVFAAFQAPVLSLSARVLFHHRMFTALLLLRTGWRAARRLSQADVATALLVPSGIELYAVTVRPRCTSSRKHVGSPMLVLAADLAPGVVIVSDRFAIYARHAARHMEECWFIGPRTGSPAYVAVVDPDLCMRKPGPLGMAVTVIINSAIGLTEEENELMASGVVPVLRANVPGYLVHKSSVHPSIVIIVLGFQSPQDFIIADGFAQRYMCNDIRNPLNRNLVGDGVVHPLLISTNTD
eukprot:m51a1_g1380 hypothetical protein (465) ;mRNA; f:448261-450251